MARKVRDKGIDSREARNKLKPRGKPYYREIERGLHLGYRKLKGRAGTWWARHYVGNQRYTVESIGAADDLSDADGVAILDYWQAQTKAREMMVTRAHVAAGKTGPLTVAQAVENYLDYLDTNKKSGRDARGRYNAFIRDELGHLVVNELRADQIRAWHVAMAKQPPRVRTREGEPQRFRELGKDAEAVRKRRTTANRTLTILRAALTMVWGDGKVASDAAWRKVKPFRGADAARIQLLTVAEAKRLINSCDADFRKMVEAALQTGCRYGELANLTARDFNPDAGTIAITVSKTGKPRHVILTEEGVSFFRELSVGNTGDQLILTHADGSPWNKSNQQKPMADACARAKIKPAIGFHGLRHTWASLAVMSEVPLMVVARNLGHSTTRMCEKNYAHLAPSYVRAEIMKGAPRFGFKPSNVRPLT
jgi:integrase